jgi:hypothetical protein
LVKLLKPLLNFQFKSFRIPEEMAGVATIFNDNVHDKSGNKVDLKTKCADKIVGIYFSAHWY